MSKVTIPLILKVETNGFAGEENFSILQICITDVFARILYSKCYFGQQTDGAQAYNRISQGELNSWAERKIISEFMLERALKNIFAKNTFIVKSKEFYEKYFESLCLETPDFLDLQELCLAKTGKRIKVPKDILVPDTAYNDCLCMISVINQHNLLDLNSEEELINLEF